MTLSDNKTKVCSQIADICSRIARSFDILQKHHADQAVKYGYCRDKFEQLRDFHQQFANCDVPEDTWASLGKFEQFVISKQSQIETQAIDISSGAFVVSTSAAISDIMVLPLDLGSPHLIKSSKVPPWWKPDKIEEYAQAFDNIGPQLGIHLRAAWESYHGTTYDPERGVLYHLRELSDQFFRAIAPNAEVQKSIFFKKKKPPKKNQVYREERFKYAASRIQNKEFAGYLSSVTPDLVKLHKKLNSLHKSGRIEPAYVRDTIIATADLLFQWVKAMKNN